MSGSPADEKALAFFNRLSGRLKIELTEEPVQASPRLSNLAAPPTARVVNGSLRMRVFEGGGFRELTDGEWSLVVLRAAAIRIRNESVPDVVVDHPSRTGRLSPSETSRAPSKRPSDALVARRRGSEESMLTTSFSRASTSMTPTPGASAGAPERGAGGEVGATCDPIWPNLTLRPSPARS
jgi:hypothetical protein